MINIKSHRRTVAKCDEIPVKYLTEKAIEKRCKKKDYHIGEKAKKAILEAYSELSLSCTHKTVQAMLEAVDQSLQSSGVKRISVCTKGCAACCDLAVDISLAEAENIAYHTGIKIQPDPNRAINTPCPFSANNTCSIYPYRPLSCRCFLTIDSPIHCYENTTHNYHSINSHVMYTQISTEMIQARPIKLGMIDIRHFFPEQNLTVFA